MFHGGYGVFYTMIITSIYEIKSGELRSMAQFLKKAVIVIIALCAMTISANALNLFQADYDNDQWSVEKIEYEHDDTISDGWIPLRAASEYLPIDVDWNSDTNVLSRLDIPFIRQKTFEDLKSVKNNYMFFDFYLPNDNLLIEYQGEFHDGIPFKKNPNGIQSKQKWEEQKERDDIKRKWAKNHNIELLEIWYYNKAQIEEILKEALCLC